MTRRTHIGLRTAGTFAAVAALSLIGGIASAQEAWTPQFVDGKLQPLPDGFPNQAISLVVLDEPGSSDGVYARDMQSALRDISPVAIEVIDRGEVGTYPTWEALGWSADQPDGDQGYFPIVYVLPGSVLDLLTVPIERDLNVTMDALNFVNVTEVTPYVVTSRKDAPWGNSFEKMVEYVVAHPGEVKYLSRSPGSGGYTAMERYSELKSLQFDKAVGGSHNEIQSAIGAGVADIGITQVETAMTHWEAGKIEILMVTGDQRAGAPWADVPSAADMGMPGEPWAQNRGFAVNDKVPDLHRQWLFELFKAGAETQAFKDARTRLPGNALVMLDHDEVRAMADKAREIADPVIRKLGIHWEQQEQQSQPK
jgi:tripartite-type tricarboxylate transporter receptor subunit TctC